MKTLWQRCRLYLSFLVPLIWRRLGLRQMLRAHFDRYDIDFADCPAGAHSAAPPIKEALVIPDHPIAAHPGETEDFYRGYLRKNTGQTTPRLSGVIHLSDAKLSYPTGVHGSRAGLVLKTYPSASVLDNPKYALSQATLPMVRAQTSHPQGILFYTCWTHNFFHWTLDILPRLALVDAVPALDKVPLIMFDGAPGFVKKSLALAVPDRPVLWLPAGTHRFDTLAVPTNLASFDIVSGRALTYLRDSYHPALQRALPADFASAKRIYISRADAAIRRIANEAEIEARLTALGFQSVVMSDHSIAEQAEIFARAECIVSAHGAALVNLAFCAPKTRVIEIFQQGHKSRSYYTISGLLGLTYGFMIGQKAGGDTAVEADQLIGLLEQMGIAAP